MILGVLCVFTVHTQQTIDIISMVPDGGTIYDLPDEYWNIRKFRKGFERMPSFKPCHTVDTGHRNDEKGATKSVNSFPYVNGNFSKAGVFVKDDFGRFLFNMNY